MNSLSWFLYFADVLPNVANVSKFFLISLFVFGLPLMTFWTMYYYENMTKGENILKPKWGIFSVVSVLLLCLTTLLPSKETIYLIAGSEAGEAVVASPEGQEILNDIHQVIKHQLGQLKGNTDE